MNTSFCMIYLGFLHSFYFNQIKVELLEFSSFKEFLGFGYLASGEH